MKTVYEIRKINTELMIKHSESRRVFSQKIGIEYNLLNQYLSKKNPKNIGDKLAQKITDAHNVPTGWLDNIHDEFAIKNVILNDVATHSDAPEGDFSEISENHPSIDQNYAVKSITLLNNLIMNKGEDLEISNNVKETVNIYAPPGLINPIAYQITGTGFSKPYRNGYVVVCEFSGDPVPGEEVLIFCKNGKIYAGEFLYQQDILFSIDSITGEKDEILKENIARVSPIKAFISPSQITR